MHPVRQDFLFIPLNSLETVKGTCNQWRLWSDCVDVQADLCLRWSHKSYCRFYRVLTHNNIIVLIIVLNFNNVIILNFWTPDFLTKRHICKQCRPRSVSSVSALLVILPSISINPGSADPRYTLPLQTALFVIKYVNLYKKHGLCNLTGW